MYIGFFPLTLLSSIHRSALNFNYLILHFLRLEPIVDPLQAPPTLPMHAPENMGEVAGLADNTLIKQDKRISYN